MLLQNTDIRYKDSEGVWTQIPHLLSQDVTYGLRSGRTGNDTVGLYNSFVLESCKFIFEKGYVPSLDRLQLGDEIELQISDGEKYTQTTYVVNAKYNLKKDYNTTTITYIVTPKIGVQQTLINFGSGGGGEGYQPDYSTIGLNSNSELAVMDYISATEAKGYVVPNVSFSLDDPSLSSLKVGETTYKVVGTGGGYEPDNVTIELNGDEELQVKDYISSTAAKAYVDEKIADVASDINDETNARTNADNQLSGQISQVSGDLTSEISARTAADTQISTLVSSLSDSLSTHTQNTNVHVTTQNKEYWNGKQDSLTSDSEIELKKVWFGQAYVDEQSLLTLIQNVESLRNATEELHKNKENRLQAGTGVTINRDDPDNPIISATGEGGGVPLEGFIAGKNITLDKDSENNTLTISSEGGGSGEEPIIDVIVLPELGANPHVIYHLTEQSGDYAPGYYVYQEGDPGYVYVSRELLNGYSESLVYDELDYDYAFEHIGGLTKIEGLSGCSAINTTDYVGKNFDWEYNNEGLGVVKTLGNETRRKSIAFCTGLTSYTDRYIAKSNYDEETYKVLPFMANYAVNESGVSATMNIVARDGRLFEYTVPSTTEMDSIYDIMLPRYVVDNFDTASEACEFIKNFVKVQATPAITNMDCMLQFLICDDKDSFVLEFVQRGDGFEVVTINKNYLTNFSIAEVIFNADGTVYTPSTMTKEDDAVKTNNILPHGNGLERWNYIVNSYGKIQDLGSLQTTLEYLNYKNAYLEYTYPFWYTEEVGYPTYDGSSEMLRVDNPDGEYQYAKGLFELAYENRRRAIIEQGDEATTWYTAISLIYDKVNKACLFTTPAEDGKEYSVSMNDFGGDNIVNSPAGYIKLLDSNDSFQVDWKDVQNKPFYSVGKGLQTDNNTISVDNTIVNTNEEQAISGFKSFTNNQGICVSHNAAGEINMTSYMYNMIMPASGEGFDFKAPKFHFPDKNTGDYTFAVAEDVVSLTTAQNISGLKTFTNTNGIKVSQSGVATTSYKADRINFGNYELQFPRQSGTIAIQGQGGEAVWGQIAGTLSDQTDLQKALDDKQNAQDESLITDDKTVVGAINELKTAIDGAEKRLNSLNGN